MSPMSNHLEVWAQFLDTDVTGAAVESDPDGIYYRQELAFHSKSAAWHESEEGAKVWQAAGSLKQEPES